MSIQLKPGKWKTRDGRVAVIEFRTECQGDAFRWMGFVGSLNRWWADDGKSMNTNSFDLIAPYTEPRLRPWKPEEVPVGALIRAKRHLGPTRHMIVAVDYEGLDAGRHFHAHYQWAVENAEHSTDGGKTWLPCGVMEDGE